MTEQNNSKCLTAQCTYSNILNIFYATLNTKQSKRFTQGSCLSQQFEFDNETVNNSPILKQNGIISHLVLAF